MTAPWEDRDDKQLSGMIKKAKRKTLQRNIAISFIVTIVVLFGGMLINVQLTGSSASRAMLDEYALKAISGPNQYISGYTDESGLLSGRMEMNMYKVVEGVPVPWLVKKTVYRVLPFYSFTNLGGSGSGLTLSLPDPGMTSENYEYYRGYNGYNGQREMMFYLPEVNYNGKILNDLPAAAQMDAGKLVEMAVSFDKSYTLAEVRAMLPTDLTQMWYWVDTYDNKKMFAPHPDGNGGTSYATPQGTGWLYGFGVNLDGPEVTENNFIESLQYGLKGRYHYEFNRINDYLRGDKAKPGAADIRLFGVVVTGTAGELQSLEGQPYVRAAVLGAVVDRY